MKKKIISLLTTLIIVVGLICVIPVMSAGAAAKNVINYNVSSSAVTKNATDGKLPSAATVYAGNSYYYNIQVSKDLKVKSFKLYVKDVGKSNYTCAFTDTAKNYMRYTSKKYTFKKAGNVRYYWQIKYTNGKTKKTPAKTVKVKAPSPSSTASNFQIPMKSYNKTNYFGKYCRYMSGATYNGKTRAYHLGVDYCAVSGGNQNVYSFASGTVAKVGYNKANGNYVVIKHTISNKTVYSFYAHLKSYCVSANNKVNSGTKIGVVGKTGTGGNNVNHLHFAVANKLWSGSYWGYATYFTGNKTNFAGVTYYNPEYIIKNGKLPS